METKERFVMARNSEGTLGPFYLTDPFEKIREHFARWSALERKYIPLRDMDSNWINKVIEWYLDIRPEARIQQIDDWALCLYIREKQYRNIDLEELNPA